MNTALWVVAGVLAVAFLASGLMKLTQSKDKFAARGMGWTEDFSAGTIRAIGLLEALGAIGLVLPGLTGIAAASSLVPRRCWWPGAGSVLTSSSTDQRTRRLTSAPRNRPEEPDG